MKRESSRDKPYDAIAGLQAATLEVGKMALLHGADRLGVAARPSPVIVGVFRVCHIAKHSRLRGVISFTLILATRTKSYVAIAGQSGSHVSVGDLVFIKGCVLQRGGRVLIASSLDRMARNGTSVRRNRLVAVDLKGPRGGKSL